MQAYDEGGPNRGPYKSVWNTYACMCIAWVRAACFFDFAGYLSCYYYYYHYYYYHDY